MSTQAHASDSASAAHAPQAPGPVATPADPALTDPLPFQPSLLAGPARPGRGNQVRRTATILQMQRTAGNRHTRQALQRVATTPAAQPPLVIQRQLDLDASWNGYSLYFTVVGEGAKATIQKKFGDLEAEEKRLAPDNARLSVQDKAQYDSIKQYIATAKARKQIPYTEKDKLEAAIDQHLATAQKIATPAATGGNNPTTPAVDPVQKELDALKAQMNILENRQALFEGGEAGDFAAIKKFIDRFEDPKLPSVVNQWKGKIAGHKNTADAIVMATKARAKQASKNPKTQPVANPAPVQPPLVQTPAKPDPAQQQLAADKLKLKTAWEDQAFKARVQEAKTLIETKKDKPVSDKVALVQTDVEAAKDQAAVTKAQKAVDDLRIFVDAKLNEKQTKIDAAIQNLVKDHAKDATESHINTEALKQKVPGAVREISAKYHIEQRTATFEAGNVATITAKSSMIERTELINDLIKDKTLRGSTIRKVYRSDDDKKTAKNYSIEMWVDGLSAPYVLHAHIDGDTHTVAGGGNNPVHIKPSAKGDTSYKIKAGQWATILPASDKIEAARNDQSLWEYKDQFN